MVLLIIDKETEDWKIITREEKAELPEEEQEKVLYLDGKEKKKLDFAQGQREKDNDVVVIVSGKEGSGKSSLAGNEMRYISKDKFDPKKHLIGSDYEDGIKKIEEAPYKGFLMFDEGNVFFLSTDVMKRESRDLHKIFSIFRQKNLFVIIVLPSFFRLNSYFALDRSAFLCRTYIKNGERSHFAYYGTRKKAQLYYKGREGYNDNAVSPTFRGRFTKCYLLETKEYKNFKLDTLQKSIKIAKVVKKKTPTEVKRDVLQEMIRNNPDKTSIELSKTLGISSSYIRALRLKEKSDKKDTK